MRREAWKGRATGCNMMDEYEDEDEDEDEDMRVRGVD